MKDIKGIAENLGLLIGTVFIGIMVYGFVILPAIYAILLRKNPFRLLNCVAKSLLTALGIPLRGEALTFIAPITMF